MSDLTFDNGEFARRERTLQGELALAELPRVAADVLGGSAIQFALAGNADKYKRLTLDLRVGGQLELKCQRCLKSLPFEIDIATRFTLFADEAKLDEAEAEDEDMEGLLFEQEFSLLNLIEDEILLSLPYAPAHDACVAEAGVAPDADVVPQKPNPFAVLADLKGKLQRGEH